MKPEFDFENNTSLKERKVPFSLPDGYFENLEEKIMSRIWLQSLGYESAGLEINKDYFDSLPDLIMSRISIGEASNIESGFTVPDGYFNQNTEKILQNDKIVNAKPRKVVFKYQTLMRIAAVAACLIIGIVFILRNQANSVNFDKGMNELSASEISNKLQQDEVDEAIIIPYLDATALDDHLGNLEEEELLKQLTEEDLIPTDI